jgi:histidine triad (HIT) family protein
MTVRAAALRAGSVAAYTRGLRRGESRMSTPRTPTLFEKIISGDVPADFVHRDERVVAFRDIHPQAPVHVLIIPVKPIPTANDIEDEDAGVIGHMFCVARDIARAEGIAEDGYRLIINCNRHGGQEVYHLHLHLLGGRPLGRMLPPR